jgi:biphenyl 2,3-dioxygenase subunit beta
MTAQLVDETSALALVAPELQQKIEQFYYYEAELLDEWKFRDWYSLFTEDTHYRLPIRRNRLRRQRFAD